MPIVGEGENTHIEYYIPEDIKERIPPYFYCGLAGEIFATYGCKFSLNYIYKHSSGTNAWVMAFKMACYKLDMVWLWDYYNSLEWYDADLFDAEIEIGIEKYFIKGKNNNINSYYKYLLDKE